MPQRSPRLQPHRGQVGDFTLEDGAAAAEHSLSQIIGSALAVLDQFCVLRNLYLATPEWSSYEATSPVRRRSIVLSPNNSVPSIQAFVEKLRKFGLNHTRVGDTTEETVG